MPYKSLAQERFFNANKAELESKGVDVDEFNAASKGKKLPEKSPNTKSKPAKPRSLGASSHLSKMSLL